MASVIQTQTFHQTFQGVYVGGLDSAIDSLWSQANSFMATLKPQDVLNVEAFMSPVGTNESNLHFQIIVTYLQE